MDFPPPARYHSGPGNFQTQRRRPDSSPSPQNRICLSVLPTVPSLTALENVELPLLLSGAKNTEATALERLHWVGLDDKAGALPYQVLRSTILRVAIARALVHDPAVLIADEPTGNLDNASGDVILKLIRRAADELGAAVLIATHSAEAAAIADLRVRMGGTGTLRAWSEALPPTDSPSAAPRFMYRHHPHGAFDRPRRCRGHRDRAVGDAATGSSNPP